MYTGRHATRALRSDVAYDQLKRQLLAGDFPLNVRLGEERLAKLLYLAVTSRFLQHPLSVYESLLEVA